MAIRQTRIYAPAKAPYDSEHWAETMMARILKPLVSGSNKLQWFWITRYATQSPEFADSDGAKVPSGFFENNPCRSLRFRFEVADDGLAGFEQEGSRLVAQEGCWIADWREYGIGELCSDRFIGEDRSQARRDERLRLVRQYVESVSRLMLHALVPADTEGRFRLENNDDSENPHNSAFFSLHHFFCNPTEVLLTVLVTDDGSNLQVGTRQYPPEALVIDPNKPFAEYRVRF